MQHRIAALEDALDLQSDGHHPLLLRRLTVTNNVKKLNISREAVSAGAKTADARPESDRDVAVKSFGTLSIGNNAMRYIGSHAAEVGDLRAL